MAEAALDQPLSAEDAVRKMDRAIDPKYFSNLICDIIQSELDRTVSTEMSCASYSLSTLFNEYHVRLFAERTHDRTRFFVAYRMLQEDVECTSDQLAREYIRVRARNGIHQLYTYGTCQCRSGYDCDFHTPFHEKNIQVS